MPKMLSNLFNQGRKKEEEPNQKVFKSQRPPKLNLMASPEAGEYCSANGSSVHPTLNSNSEILSKEHAIENSWPKGQTPVPYKDGHAPKNQYETGRVISLNKFNLAYSLVEGGGILGSFSVSGSGIIKKLGEDQWYLDLEAIGKFPLDGEVEVIPAASARLIVDGKLFGPEIPFKVEGDMIWGGDQKPFGKALIPLPHYGRTVEIGLDYNYLIKTAQGYSSGRSMIGHMIRNATTKGPPIPKNRYSLFP